MNDSELEGTALGASAGGQSGWGNFSNIGKGLFADGGPFAAAENENGFGPDRDVDLSDDANEDDDNYYDSWDDDDDDDDW